MPGSSCSSYGWVPIIVLGEKYYVHCSLRKPFPTLDKSALCPSTRLPVWGFCTRGVRAAREATTSELTMTALLLDAPYSHSDALPAPFCFGSYCNWQKHMSWLVTLMGRISNVLHTWDSSNHGPFSPQLPCLTIWIGSLQPSWTVRRPGLVPLGYYPT